MLDVHPFFKQCFFNSTSVLLNSFMNWASNVAKQEFIQAILMSSRQHKKLNLLIEFSNSIFRKFYFKAYWHWTYIQYKIGYYVSSILNHLFVLQMSNVKRSKDFKALPTEPLLRLPPWTHCRAYSISRPPHPPCIWQHWKSQSLFKNGH